MPCTRFASVARGECRAIDQRRSQDLLANHAAMVLPWNTGHKEKEVSRRLSSLNKCPVQDSLLLQGECRAIDQRRSQDLLANHAAMVLPWNTGHKEKEVSRRLSSLNKCPVQDSNL